MLDLRSRQSPIRDQGRRGTCVAFAATAAHEMLRAEGSDLSEEFLHWAAKQRDGFPLVEGTTLVAAATALADVGQPPEEIWPYDDQRDQHAASYRPPNDAHAAALTRRLVGGGPIEPSARGIRNGLREGLAPLLGIRLYPVFYSPSSSGRVEMPPPGAPELGGHAVLVVGYIDGEGAGGGCFIVRNSWGPDWGIDGYGYLPYAYIDAHGLQSWGLEEQKSEAGEQPT